MKIAILGAGFCGLATAWSFLQPDQKFPLKSVTLFDSKKIGQGTSGLAAGLLHPFVGLHSKLNPFGLEGFEASEKLIAISETQLGRPTADRSGIFRLALTDVQNHFFRKAAELYPAHISWLDAESLSLKFPYACKSPGIHIKTAMTVYAKDYLNGLWLACQQLGAKFIHQSINSLRELDAYDLIIGTMGAECGSLPEFNALQITRTKGQLLELNWPEGYPPLSAPLNSQIYCIMSPDKSHCIAGATYEKQFDSSAPDVEVAISFILPKLHAMLPILEDEKILSCRAGVRASTPNRLPLITKINDKCWILTGMGSRGLLYHALFANQLKASLMNI